MKFTSRNQFLLAVKCSLIEKTVSVFKPCFEEIGNKIIIITHYLLRKPALTTFFTAILSTIIMMMCLSLVSLYLGIVCTVFMLLILEGICAVTICSSVIIIVKLMTIGLLIESVVLQ